MKSKNQKILEMSRRQDVQPDELAEYIYILTLLSKEIFSDMI